VSLLGKTFSAVTLLAAVWALTLVEEPGSRAWLRPAGVQPGPVRILRFYASVGLVVNGEAAKICYGVENAKSVRISPPIPGVYPSVSRCLQVAPDHTTHYTIVAEGYDGKVAFQSLTLPVEDVPVTIAPEVNVASAGGHLMASEIAFSASGPMTSYPASLGWRPSQVSSFLSIPLSSSMALQ